jgi:hypothetical protein
MLKERNFQVVLVSKDKAVGFTEAPPAKSVHYVGEAVAVKLR